MSWLDDIANQNGFDPDLLRRIIHIESGGKPYASTGSYHGMMQLSNGEFQNYQPGGNIWDPVANVKAGVAKLQSEMQGFAERFGRQPTATDIYLTHQQGPGGIAMHLEHPDWPAWQNRQTGLMGRSKRVVAP